MLTIKFRFPWEMISGFNLTVTRREKTQGMKEGLNGVVAFTVNG